MNKKKVLILGATGAMAVYLIPELLRRGYKVDGVSLDSAESDNEDLKYITANALDMDFLENQLKENYDAIVDFMIYNSVEKFERYYKLFLDNTEHYIFLSTYRVYAGDSPITENSRRLLDIEKPSDFVSEREYCIYKAEEEDLLRGSDYRNYTIIRPAITYSKRRFQLTIFEADIVIHRALAGKEIVLPEGAMDKQATMSWAGDVAKMISALILNPKAYCETYTVSTAEHMTWREIAEIYKRVYGLKYVVAPNEVFLNIKAPGCPYAKQQLLYDRCFDRVIDNSKILEISGLSQEDLMPLREGLERELKALDPSTIPTTKDVEERMDNYLNSIRKG